MVSFEIKPVGDAMMLVEFEARIDVAINRRVTALAATIATARLAGVRDIVPTYRSLAIFFDPLRTDVNSLTEKLGAGVAELQAIATGSVAPLEIPVCYCGVCGPDLESVAAFGHISSDEVVAIHTAGTYRVFMLGFLPGFAYMGLVDERIAAPRHANPRLAVRKGSIGIAGRQTGVYPSDTPGGWQIVGRTPLDPFNMRRTDPFLFAPGDDVRFVPIPHPQALDV